MNVTNPSWGKLSDMNTLVTLNEWQPTDYFGDVLEFHKAFNHPCPQTITPMNRDRLAIRVGFMLEEISELLAADDQTDQVDALIDLLWFTFGTFVEMGVDPGPLWDIVKEANMSKLFPDGKPHYRESDGKIIKPDGWTSPEPLIKAHLESLND